VITKFVFLDNFNSEGSHLLLVSEELLAHGGAMDHDDWLQANRIQVLGNQKDGHRLATSRITLYVLELVGTQIVDRSCCHQINKSTAPEAFIQRLVLLGECCDFLKQLWGPYLF
jgi:hypothetical protein